MFRGRPSFPIRIVRIARRAIRDVAAASVRSALARCVLRRLSHPCCGGVHFPRRGVIGVMSPGFTLPIAGNVKSSAKLGIGSRRLPTAVLHRPWTSSLSVVGFEEEVSPACAFGRLEPAVAPCHCGQVTLGGGPPDHCALSGGDQLLV
jgi:hypothetical protein